MVASDHNNVRPCGRFFRTHQGASLRHQLRRSLRLCGGASRPLGRTKARPYGIYYFVICVDYYFQLHTNYKYG